MAKFNYDSLVAALISARMAAEEAAPSVDDAGTSNFDACTLLFPGVKVAEVERAGVEARMMMVRYSSGEYHIRNPVSSQGARRTKQAEVIRDVLRRMGYETASVFYKMD